MRPLNARLALHPTMSRTPRNVPLLARRLDLGGMVLLLAGAACYLRAYVGLIGLQQGVAPGSARFAGIREFDGYWQLSRIGIGIGAIAIVVMIAAAAIAWRARHAPVITEPSGAEPAAL